MKSVLFLHAIGSSNQSKKIAKLKNKLGMNSLTPDFPQHGDNNNEFNVDIILRDLEKEFSKMESSNERYLVGRSFGAYIALILLKRYPNFFRKACLMSPAISMEKTMQTLINNGYVGKDFKLKGRTLAPPLHFREFDKEVKKFNSRIPILIVHGEKDNIIELSELNFLIGKENVIIKVFPVGHSYNDCEEEILDNVKDFIFGASEKIKLF